MAMIELIHEASEHLPVSTETIEVRPWDLGGRHNQPFYIGSGLNYQADQNIWLEIIYSVEGAQIFYPRNFLHHSWGFDLNEQLGRLQGLSDAVLSLSSDDQVTGGHCGGSLAVFSGSLPALSGHRF